MPNIVKSVAVMQPQDLAWQLATSTHPAIAGKLYYRKLGGMLEVMCQVNLAAAVTSGAVLGSIPVRCIADLGTLQRYTSSTDTSPDVRRCSISSDGVITNTSGLAFVAGYTLSLSLITPTV